MTDQTPYINELSKLQKTPHRREHSGSPLPLQRIYPDSQPYPSEALGSILGPAVKRLNEVIQAPEAQCAQSILAAATLAVHGHRDVSIDGRRHPISQFFLTIGESGERKSATDNEALREHRAYEQELNQVHEVERQRYEREYDAYMQVREAILRKKGKGVTYEQKKAEMAELPECPVPPISPILIMEEPTYEGLIKNLIVGQPALGLFTDEGGRLIGGHGMNQDNQLKTASGLSELWDGKRVTKVRVDGSTSIYGRRVSMHVMMQPKVADQLVGNRVLLDQGLLSRCLLAFPKSTAGSRLYQEIDLSKDKQMKIYHDRMRLLLKMPKNLKEGTLNTLEPTLLTLEPAAKELWVKAHNDNELKLGKDGLLAPVKGFANKAPEHILRIAAVLTLVSKPDATRICVKEINSAIQIVNFYTFEALRLLHTSGINPETDLAQKTIQWVHSQGYSEVYLAQLYQLGPNAIRESNTARRIAKLLENHGWFKELDPKELDGSMRSEVWEVQYE